MVIMLSLLAMTGAWAIWAIRKQRTNSTQLVMMLALYALLFLSGFQNFRAGLLSDKNNLNGCTVNLLGCWGAPIMLGLFVLTLVYQITLILLNRPSRKKS
jgi:hypothetical protein